MEFLKNSNVLVRSFTEASLASKILLYPVFLCIPLAFYGGETDFSPSSNWQFYGTIISVIVAMLISFPMIYHLFNGKIALKKDKEIWTPFVIPIFILMCFISIRITVVHSLGDIFTRMAGREQIVTANVYKHIPRSRKQCEYQIRGDLFSRAFPDYFCISENQFKILPYSTEVLLQINRSFFGDHIYDLATNR